MALGAGVQLLPRRNRTATQLPAPSRPLSECSTAVPSNWSTPVLPITPTSVLVEFLRTTEPPASHDDGGLLKQTDKPSWAERYTFSLLRDPKAVKKSKSSNFASSIVLPYQVVSRRSSNGKPYYQIATPYRFQTAGPHGDDGLFEHRGEHRESVGTASEMASTTGHVPRPSDKGRNGGRPSVNPMMKQVQSTSQPVMGKTESVRRNEGYALAPKARDGNGPQHARKLQKPVKQSQLAKTHGPKGHVRLNSDANMTAGGHTGSEQKIPTPFRPQGEARSERRAMRKTGIPRRTCSMTSRETAVVTTVNATGQDHDRVRSGSKSPTQPGTEAIARTIQNEFFSNNVWANSPDKKRVMKRMLPTFDPHKALPPSPGPAPTRALPSLPEVSDEQSLSRLRKGSLPNLASSHHDREVDISRRRSMIIPPRSPIHETVPSMPADEDSGLKMSPSQKAREELWIQRRIREEKVRARKMRDIQMSRGLFTNKPTEAGDAGVKTASELKLDEQGQLGEPARKGSVAKRFDLVTLGTGMSKTNMATPIDLTSNTSDEEHNTSPTHAPSKHDSPAATSFRYPDQPDQSSLATTNMNPTRQRSESAPATSDPSTQTASQTHHPALHTANSEKNDIYLPQMLSTPPTRKPSILATTPNSTRSSWLWPRETELESRIRALEENNALLREAVAVLLQGSASGGTGQGGGRAGWDGVFEDADMSANGGQLAGERGGGRGVMTASTRLEELASSLTATAAAATASSTPTPPTSGGVAAVDNGSAGSPTAGSKRAYRPCYGQAVFE